MSSKRPAIAFFILAAYLLAVTVGGWFHTHGHHGDGGPEGCCASAACGGLPGHDEHDACAHGRDAGRSEAPGGRIPSRSDESDSCPVCHFLAQKPVPAEPIEPVASEEALEEVALAAPAPVFADVPSVHHSRAPPRPA